MGDKNFSAVSGLASFDGADGATTTVDDSTNNHTMTFVSTAALETDDARFGPSSLRVLSTGGCGFPANAVFDFGAGDFTVEFWFNALSVSGQDTLIAKALSAGGQVSWGIYFTALVMRGGYSTDGSNFFSNDYNWDGGTLISDEWNYCAWVRDGNTLRGFHAREGDEFTTEIGTTDITGVTFFSSTAIVGVGGNNDLTTIEANAFFDEVRITKGLARYTAPFRTPQGPFSKRKAVGVTPIIP